MTYGSFDYTSLLYLSDYLEDFGGGRFVFMEEGANKTVEPRAGRTHRLASRPGPGRQPCLVSDHLTPVHVCGPWVGNYTRAVLHSQSACCILGLMLGVSRSTCCCDTRKPVSVA